MTIVRFSCPACGVCLAEALVRDRKPKESRRRWLKAIGPDVGVAHFLRSPECEEELLDIEYSAAEEEGGN